MNASTRAETDALFNIERLVQFALNNEMIHELDVQAVRNSLLELFRFTEPYEGETASEELDSPVTILETLLDYGYSIGLIPDNITTYRDLLDARIMGLLMPRPSDTARAFERDKEVSGIEAATDRFYKLNLNSNYIRMDRIRKNMYWQNETQYGNLEITINLSKPEKDPKEIALLRSLPQANYPKCLLCADNVGYAGRADHPARQNLRVLPLELQGERWYFQYSPYVYYNEHSIVLKGAHDPMAISHRTFARLLDFIDLMPHYFIGSNADLPIVGGSILSHDHFQAGRHIFPMEMAPVETAFRDPAMPEVSFGIVKWPMSVVRVSGHSKEDVYRAACRLLDSWRGYSDPQADVLAYTEQADGTCSPHNTITPIARLRDGDKYELDLVLRNNRTSAEHPDGIYHPHQELHHIKKENIGLIEVMGLAVLPGRLKEELEQLAAYLTANSGAAASELREDGHILGKHADWLEALIEQYGSNHSAEEAQAIIRKETGNKFLEVLKHAGVYKRSQTGAAAFESFMRSAGLEKLG